VSDPDPEAVAPSPAELSLSEPERVLLLAIRSATGATEEEELSERTGLAPETVRGSLQRLRSKHLLAVEEEHLTRPLLTARGRTAVERGLPERRLLACLIAGSDPSGAVDEAERSIAIGVLRRAGRLAPGMPLRLAGSPGTAGELLPDESALADVAAGRTPEPRALAPLERRGLVTQEHRTHRRWRASAAGARLELADAARPLLGALTPELLREGRWRGATFRPYDVRAEVPFRTGPEPHPYARFLEEFAEILVGLGFEEAEGPLVETEFWNNDVLYMPQEHPARSVHDVFGVVDLTGRAGPYELAERVAAAHEGRALPEEEAPLSLGWRVPYRPEIARRVVLRSQTTAVSARYLARGPRPPFRMFCLDRNFRPEALDATHHIEFAQCEGVVGEEGISLRELVGIFQELAEGIGIRELKVRPSYFPFTEPSVEGYVRHPRLGWMEVFPGGLLRPEVLRPLRIGVPVAAWGIGVSRLAMVALHVNDIRELFTDDLGRLTGRGT
jgi:phenylalanyl-tRNA synthetase alpha chain